MKNDEATNTAVNADIEVMAAKKPPGMWKLFWIEIKNDKLAIIGLFIVVFVVVFAYVGSAYLGTEAANVQDLWNRNNPPSWWEGGAEGHLLGTDTAGRDVFARLVIGTRNSLTLGWTVAFISIVIGIVVGIIAGFYGGHVDNIIMRIVDTWMMVPSMMFIIALVSTFDRTVPLFITFLVMFTWMGRARTVRAMALQQRNMDYVSASKTLGTRNIKIILTKVLPNMVSILTADIVLTMSTVIGIETTLTLLGFGLRPGTPSLGDLVATALNPANLANRPWLWFPAILTMFILMMCINFVGQAIARAADPRQRLV